MMRAWIGTTRYIYNRCLSAIKTDNEKINFQSLRNKFVTAKNNPNIQNWELETPKDIRAEAIRDLTKAYHVAMINLKNNNINKFDLKFRTKKKESSIAIPYTAISFKKNDKKLYIFKSYMKEPIKLSKDKSLKNIEINHTCRLKNDKGKWFLYIPIKTKLKEIKPTNQACSLDPGIRKFQTIYSEKETVKIIMNKDHIKKLQNKLDLFQSLRSKKLISKSHYQRKINKINHRFKNLIDDLHFQTITYLTNTFKTIFIPKFESQELVRVNKLKKCRRDLLSLQHYTFQQRLMDKSKLKNGCKVMICTEEYTSKTCSSCGIINDKLGSNELFICKSCNLQIDRDINGARNIFIKNVKEIDIESEKYFKNI